MRKLYMVLGAIGSGKSTLCKKLLNNKETFKINSYISSDSYKEKFFDNCGKKSYRAGDELSLNILNYVCENENDDILFEFCPVRPMKIKTVEQIIKANKIKLVVFIIHNDNFVINKNRIVKKGINQNKIENSFESFFKNSAPFIQLASKVYFIDNSNEIVNSEENDNFICCGKIERNKVFVYSNTRWFIDYIKNFKTK